MLWTPDDLREFTTDDEPTVRRWAIDRLTRLHPPSEWESTALELLEDDDDRVAMNAFGALRDLGADHVSELSFDVGGEWSLRLAAFAGREGAVEDAWAASLYPEVVASSPDWVVEHADPEDTPLGVLAMAHVPGFAPDFVERMLEDLDRPDDPGAAEEVRQTAVSSTNVWHQPELPDELDEELEELREASDWPAFVRSCLARLGDLASSVETDDRHLRWGLALSQALDEAGWADGADADDARAAYSLLDGLTAAAEAIRSVQDAPTLADALVAFEKAHFSVRFRLVAPAVRERWEAEHAESEDAASAAVDTFVDEAFEGDDHEIADALDLAVGLEGYDLAPFARRAFDRLLAGTDDNAWEPFDEPLEAYFAHHPERLREWWPDDFDAEDARAPLRAFLLRTLSDTNRAWATDRLIEFPLGAPSEVVGDDVAEAIRRHADVDAISWCLETYEDRPESMYLLDSIAFLAQLGDVSLPEDVAKRVEVRRQGRAGWDEVTGGGQRAPLRFRCEDCGMEFAQAYDRLYINRTAAMSGDTDGDLILPPEVVVCPVCGAEDRYTLDSLVERMTLMMTSTDLLEAIDDWTLPSGVPLGRPTPLLASVRERIADDETDVDAWDDLAGLGLLFDRDDLVEEAVAGGRAVDPDYEPPGRTEAVEPMPPEEAKLALARLRRKIPRRKRRDIGKAKKLSRYPVEEAWASDWTDPQNLVSVVVVRRLPRGKYAAAAALVDLACEGIIDGFMETSLARGGVEHLIETSPHDVEAVPAEIAARILDVGVRYALALGLSPTPEYFAIDAFVSGIEPDESEPVPTGWRGEPLLVAGPDEDVGDTLEKLDAAVGPDGYTFVRFDEDGRPM